VLAARVRFVGVGLVGCSRRDVEAGAARTLGWRSVEYVGAEGSVVSGASSGGVRTFAVLVD